MEDFVEEKSVECFAKAWNIYGPGSKGVNGDNLANWWRQDKLALGLGYRVVLYRVMDLCWQVRANVWIFYTSAEERGEIVTRIYYYSLSAEKFGQHCQEWGDVQIFNKVSAGGHRNYFNIICFAANSWKTSVLITMNADEVIIRYLFQEKMFCFTSRLRWRQSLMVGRIEPLTKIKCDSVASLCHQNFMLN